MGPSGSGKTTLLSIIAGLDLPSAGEVWIDGQRTDQLSENERSDFRAQRLGFVFQSFRLLSHLTVRENVELPFLIQKKSIDQQAVDHVLEAVGLEHRMDHVPSQVSGGEQQRVALARALVTRPPILLADEPTGNLDSHTGREILDLMKKLQREFSCTLLVVTHDPLVREFSDRVVNMHDGMLGDSLA
jgi:putative ABC transport system ATP-binding protein